MRKARRRLILMHPDAELQGLIREVSRDFFEVRTVEGWAELRAEVANLPSGALFLVDPFLGSETLNGELESILRQFPSATVVAAVPGGSGLHDDVQRLGDWGVAQIFCLEEELSPIAIRERLLAARGRPLRNLLTAVLPEGVGGSTRAILEAAVPVVSEGGTGADLARALRVAPRTLLRWCRQANLPAPKRLLAWMRVLLAAELLDDPGRSVLDVAVACGYSSDASLRQAIRTFLGASPTDLRATGAFPVAAGQFGSALLDARRAGVRYRRPSIPPA